MPKYMFKKTPHEDCPHFSEGQVVELPESFSEQFPWWVRVEEEVEEKPIAEPGEAEAVVEIVEELIAESPIIEEVEEPISEKKPKRSRRSKN